MTNFLEVLHNDVQGRWILSVKFFRWSSLSIGTKLTGGLLVLTTAFLVVMMVGINQVVTRQFQERAVAHVEEQSRVMVRLMASTHQDLRQRTDFLARAFQESLKGSLSLAPQTQEVRSRPTPTLLLDGKALNLDLDRVDRFSAAHDAVATVFVKSGEDFVRITTSLKDEQGQRALGTILDHMHPGYTALMQGQSYVGRAKLFGRDYMTRYDPLRDAQGQVVGVSFIGTDFTATMQHIKQAVRDIKIGRTGYFYVLNTAPGKNLGLLEVHPFKEGALLIEQKDADGKPFVQEMLDRKSGQIRYPWINSEAKETRARDKLVVFSHFPEWNWLVAGGAYIDEYTSEMEELRRIYLGMFGAFLAVFAAASFVLVRRWVTRPLTQVQEAATAIAQGDLTVNLHSDREDELGLLVLSMNSIGSSLSQVVQIVRDNSGSVATSCQEMAQGNQDLSTRTESQAAALEKTVSSMTELGSAAQRNAESARVASQLALEASRVADEGGVVVDEVVKTMRGISDSAKRIAEIIAVMDGISFQTNILALNAAVEAARAGDSGRGFAVVAGEVRNLASRSAEAAREIRTLIHDSVERTEEGSTLVNQAGATMSEVVRSIQRVTDIMAEISAASVEQTSEVAEVGRAVAQIDQATQQNAALVEQMAASAASLRSQADDLVMSVEVFNV